MRLALALALVMVPSQAAAAGSHEFQELMDRFTAAAPADAGAIVEEGLATEWECDIHKTVWVLARFAMQNWPQPLALQAAQLAGGLAHSHESMCGPAYPREAPSLAPSPLLVGA